MRRSFLRILAAITIMAVLAAAFTLLANASPAAPAHWSAPYNISNSPGEASGPRIVTGSNYSLHLTWVDSRTGDGDIYYTKSTNSGTSWSTLEPITTTTLVSEEGDIAVGPGTSLHSVWREFDSPNSSLEYATKADGGGWTTSTVADFAFQFHPAIAVHGDYVYLVRQKRLESGNPNIYCLRRPITDTVWPDPQLITDTVEGSVTPDLAIDSGGHMHVVWHEQVGVVGGEIWYSRGTWTDGSVSWDPVINLCQGLADCSTPAIAIGSDDYVHVVWGQKVSDNEQYVYYTNFPHDDPGSSSPKQIFDDGLGVSESAPGFLYPRLAVEGDSTVHVVWHGMRLTGDSTDRIWYSISEDKGTSWSPPTIISRDPTSQSISPDVAIDDNLVHVVWQGKDANGRSQVMYSRGFPFVVYLPVARKAY